MYPLNQRVEVREAPLTIIPKKTLAEFFTSHPATMSSSGLEVLFPKKEMLLLKDTVVPLIWKMTVPLGYLGLLTLSQWARKKKLLYRLK